ncbi:AAA family ATPase, partial [Thomasclavelia sp.]|uniref:AAA family ATPase n=1 Tax=Thomasclavelia sp. TaxID=3025757 RepID=UPI002600C8A6
DETDRHILKKLRNRDSSLIDLKESLYRISQCMQQHYHQNVIILIDEYDVPLQSAFNHGYYDEMVSFLKSVFSPGLKTNDALERGILTGCLRITKESIFTGLNNFTVRTISDKEASEYFGFTQNEIDSLLDYYNLISKRQDMKDWYDGYLFGKTVIYNPWSALNYIKKVLVDDQYEAIVIECKHSNSIRELRKDSSKASEQIIDQKYIEGLEDEGYENVIGYGISFYKKQCIITKAK